VFFNRFVKRQTIKKTQVGRDLNVYMGTPPEQVGIEPVSFAQERVAYLQRVCERYRPLALDALIPAPEQDGHPAMMLDEVFVPQLVRENPPPFELLHLPREVLRRLNKDGNLTDLPGSHRP